jgi:hypothetical protein
MTSTQTAVINRLELKKKLNLSFLSHLVTRWVQTSYNNNFRKQYAGIGYTFDSTKNKFIAPQPFASWSLDANDDWQAPVAYPTVTTYGDNVRYLFLGMKLDKDGLVKTIKITNSLGHLKLHLGLLQAIKEF